MKLVAGLSLLMLLAGCGKSEDTSSSNDSGESESASNSQSSEALKPWEDHSKPYLSEKKMGDFIASLNSDKSPFDAIMKGTVTPLNVGKKLNEFDEAAKKHGFASGEEYLGAWLRINAAQGQAGIEEMKQTMVKTHEDTIRRAEEELKKPEATAEMKEIWQEQIRSSREGLSELKKPQEGEVNASDVATYKKHRAAFEEAMKKWSK